MWQVGFKISFFFILLKKRHLQKCLQSSQKPVEPNRHMTLTSTLQIRWARTFLLKYFRKTACCKMLAEIRTIVDNSQHFNVRTYSLILPQLLFRNAKSLHWCISTRLIYKSHVAFSAKDCNNFHMSVSVHDCDNFHTQVC